MGLRIFLFTFFIGLSVISTAQFAPQKVLSEKLVNPQNIGTYDLDGDGDLDILANYYVIWYENLGDGIFSKGKYIDPGHAFSDISAADLDADGDLDVLACNYTSKTVVWYENYGDGNFGTRQLITDSLINVKSIRTGDMDGDGDLDVITGGLNEHKAYWYENDGTGHFIVGHLIWNEVDGKFSYANINDLDGDGDLDVLGAIDAYNEITWYKNDGLGTFTTRTLIAEVSAPTHIISEDLDGDGDFDVIASSNGDNEISWYENDGLGNFGVAQIITDEVNGPVRIYTSDLDGDGDLDVLSASFNDLKIAWYENDGDGNFGTQQILSLLGEQPTCVIGAEINGDAHVDVLYVSRSDNEIAWCKNLGDGTFDKPKYIAATPNVPMSVQIFDMDGDEKKDILYSSRDDGKVAWFKNFDNGEFHKLEVISDSVIGAQSVFASDLDGDGDLDVLTACSGDAKITWFENQGSSGFGFQQIISTEVYFATTVCAGDIDGDGDNDAISGSYYDNKVAWYENDGAGNFGPQQIISMTAAGTESVIAVDIDSDGDLDVLSACKNSDKIIWYVNDGGFGSEVVITDSADGAFSIHAGDIDGDGDLDVVSASAFSGEVAWFENNGLGEFIAEHSVAVSVDYATSVYVDDFDGDGDLDIAATWSYTSERITWYENDGSGNFSDEIIITTMVDNPEGIVGSDLDGDGDVDLVSVSAADNKIAWYENLSIKNEQIHGRIFYDLNENGIYDSLEIGFNEISLLSSPESDYTFTYADGKYFMNFTALSGLYEILPEEIPHWSIISDSLSYSINVDSSFSSIDSLDFGLYPDSLITVIEPSLVGGFPRCNTTINYWLNIKNAGTTMPSGIIELELDEEIEFISATAEPDSIVDHNLYWHYDSLTYFGKEFINIHVHMPSFMFMGDSLTSYLTISEVDDMGAEIYSNVDTLSQILVCAYDPNDKIATPSGSDSLGYIPVLTESLDYTIRFQNTGNDTAITVVVTDQLDPNLDWFSLDIIASSHDMKVKVEETGQVIFTFENIMLPDSTVNEIESHGFIKYSVGLLDDLPNGTKLYNTAKIYFDSNPPVYTNTKINTLFDCQEIINNLEFTTELCQGSNFIGESEIEILPPSDTYLNWNLPGILDSNGYSVITLVDTSGLFLLEVVATTNFCSADSTHAILVKPRLLTFLDSIYICEGDSTLIFENYRSVEGYYYDTLTSLTGCDSILSNYLELRTSPSIIETISICEGDSVFVSGSYETESGIFADTLSTVYGCDSILVKELLVHFPPEVSFTDLEDETICLDGGLIYLLGEPEGGTFIGTGIIGSEFSPSIAGEGEHKIYYSFEDDNGCTGIDSLQITVVDCLGIPNLTENKITLFPNPFDQYTTINFGGELDGHLVIVYDILGQEVYRNESLSGSSFTLTKQELGVGIYLLSIVDTNLNELYTAKLVAE